MCIQLQVTISNIYYKIHYRVQEFVRKNSVFLCDHSLTIDTYVTLPVGIQTFNMALFPQLLTRKVSIDYRINAECRSRHSNIINLVGKTCVPISGGKLTEPAVCR
jgi:hypothetical protein